MHNLEEGTYNGDVKFKIKKRPTVYKHRNIVISKPPYIPTYNNDIR